MRIKKSVEQLIALERVCRVATVDENGQPHLVPVVHAVANGKIYFGSGREGRKVLNLRATGRIALTVDLYSEAWSHLKGVMVQGTTRLIDKGPRFRRARALLYGKYPQYAEEAALDPSDSVIVEVTPVHLFAWGLERRS